MEQVKRDTVEFFTAFENSDLPETVHALCDLTVKRLVRHKGVVRAVSDHLLGRVGHEANACRHEMARGFKETAAFLARKVEGNRAAAREACEFAILTLGQVAQYQIVYDERAGIQFRVSNRKLKGQLTDLLLAYLRS